VVALSPTGPEVSPIVQGAMRLLDVGGPQDVLRFIHGCLELGVSTFDHADIYGSYQAEAHFGAALKLEPALRERLQLVSKCGIKLVSKQRPEHTVHGYDTSRAHIVASAERTLRNLGTDVLELLLIHRPDPLMEADEVAAALTELRSRGLVERVGVSNFTPHQFDLLQSRLDEPLVTNQVEISVMHLDAMHDGTLDQSQRLRSRPMAWSPLGSGRLWGDSEQARRVLAELERVGAEVGAAPDEVALAFVLKHPSRPVPVLGTGKLERVAAAVRALDLTLSRDQWFRLWSASMGHEVP
jgi:predicted oxidoreductase